MRKVKILAITLLCATTLAASPTAMARTRRASLLPDAALLLPKHALRQKSGSHLLSRQTRRGWMLLQGWFVPHAAQVNGHD